MPKIDNPLLLSLYSYYVDKVLSETSNVDEANQRLRDLGYEIGQQIYLNTDIVEKTKDIVTTREDVAKLIDVVYKVLYDKRPTDVDMKTARGSIRVSDNNCVWCQEVNLEGMQGFGYCQIFSGILDSILERLGNLEEAYLVDDYAEGRDTGIIDLVLVGDIDQENLIDLVRKTERYIGRKIRTLSLTPAEWRRLQKTFKDKTILSIWKNRKHNSN